MEFRAQRPAAPTFGLRSMRHRRPRGLWLPLATLLLHEIGPTKKPCPIVAQVLVRVGQCSSCFPADWWHGLVVLPGMVPSMPCVRCWQASGWPMLSFMAIGKCAWRSQLALRASRPGSRVIGWRSHSCHKCSLRIWRSGVRVPFRSSSFDATTHALRFWLEIAHARCQCSKSL